MWDLIVITAGDESQARGFRKQLNAINLRNYANNVQVVADPSDAGRLGSGGSMIYLADKLKKEHARPDRMRILLVHSGGYAQRMAYQSIYGKCFAYLPGGITVLEQKLRIYEQLQYGLSPGLVVTASDVIEDLSSLDYYRHLGGDDLDMILFASECDLQTATGHGIFVKNGSTLKCVLQKPTVEEMRNNSAVLPDGCVLTDSFYWMSWSLVSELAKLKGKRPIEQEICCYGDFMRPLGTQPKLEYLEEGSPNLQAWRKDLKNIFGGANTKVVNLGKESFFHFGTHAEMVSHLDKNSSFYKKFLSEVEESNWTIRSQTKVSDSVEGVLVEFCVAPNVVMKQNVIASCIHTTAEVAFEDVMVFTVALKGKRFVTCAIPMGMDVKKREETLLWMGRECGKNTSLWKAHIFPLRKSRNESFQATYELIKGTTEIEEKAISLEQIVFEEVDLDCNLLYKKSRQ